MSEPTSGRSATAPVIACNLDEYQVARLRAHPSNPVVLPYAVERPVWEVPPEANILFTFFRGWQTAPQHAPTGWPHNLKWVQVAATGIDNFPGWFFEAPQVTIGRGVAAEPITEYIMSAVFAYEKLIYEDIRVRSPTQWRQRPLRMVANKKLGVLGYGSIGVATAKMAAAFGMDVSIVRRTQKTVEPGIQQFETLKKMIAEVDHLVLAVPLTPATRGIISHEILDHAKPGLHIINVCRGAVIDDEALLIALQAGQVAAATLDVTDPEPLPEGHPYYQHPRIWLTPHVSWTSEDSAKRIAERLSLNLDRFLRGEALQDVADAGRGY